MPAETQEWRNRMIRLNPDFDHKLWNEDAQQQLGIPIELWESAKNYSEKSDIVRWYAARRFGGIYSDTDVEWYRPFGELMHSDCWVSFYRDRHHMTGTPMPTIFGCKPRHMFTEQCIEQLWRRKNDPAPSGDKYGTVCDWVWSSFDYPHIEHPVLLLPDCFFYPYPASERWADEANPIPPKDCRATGAFAAHHWEGSWKR